MKSKFLKNIGTFNILNLVFICDLVFGVWNFVYTLCLRNISEVREIIFFYLISNFGVLMNSPQAVSSVSKIIFESYKKFNINVIAIPTCREKQSRFSIKTKRLLRRFLPDFVVQACASRNDIKIFFLQSLFLFSLFFISCSPTEQETYNNPTTISGQVKDNQGVALPTARVSLSTAPTFNAVVTDANGLFYLKEFPSGKHRLKVEKIGFEIFEADVSSAINGVSTMNPILRRKVFSVPTVKPLSTGKVRINKKVLETDFDGDGIYEPFIVKGAAFSPVPMRRHAYASAIHQSRKQSTIVR